MTPLTTSAFDLPDHLAPKADPALIAGDEQHFAAIAESLEQSIADLSDRLDAARRAPGGTGQEAMDRDLEVHRLTARLRALRRFGLDLCLGHMVGADDAEPVYVGRLGLTDSTGRRLLVDWRSPAAEPFFGATHANPMGLASRRRYRWTRGRISDYWDEVFTAGRVRRTRRRARRPVRVHRQPGQQPVAADARRARHHPGRPGRDHPRRAPAARSSSTAVPGTGKTVVALHRTAYLLYSDPRLGHRRGGVLFVGPHQPYLAYVADVLPSLGEEGVQTCTLRDLVPEGAGAAVEADPEVARLKSSAEMVTAIEPAVRLYEEPPTKGMEVETPWVDLWLSAADWAEAFESAVPAPRTTRRATRSGRSCSRSWSTSTTTRRSRPSCSAGRWPRTPSCATRFSRAWPLIEPTDLVGDLWDVPAYLRMCAPWLEPDEVARLQRADPQAWTVSDLPLLDAARQRLGDPEASRRRRRRDAALAAEREEMAKVVDHLVATDDSDMQVMSMLRV